LTSLIIAKHASQDLPDLEHEVRRGDGDIDLDMLTPAEMHALNQSLLDQSIPDRPLIDEVTGIFTLQAEYEKGSTSFVQQINWLSRNGYAKIRRAKGDGDCFYRSLGFAYVESILNASEPNLAVAMAQSILESNLARLDDAGFQRLVFEDFHDSFAELIDSVLPAPGRPMLTLDTLLRSFQVPELSNSYVVYLRLLTSAYIRTHSDDFGAFLSHPESGNPLEAREFCEQLVESVGKEADHVQITALCRALQINISIAYLDGRSTDGSVNFVPFSFAEEGEKPILLLYRPGHYDVLMKDSKRETVNL